MSGAEIYDPAAKVGLFCTLVVAWEWTQRPDEKVLFELGLTWPFPNIPCIDAQTSPSAM